MTERVQPGRRVTPSPAGAAPLSAAGVHRIHTVVRLALGQAVKWGWIRRNPADHAEPGQRTEEEEVLALADVDVVHLLAEPSRWITAWPGSCGWPS